ncbi:MAG: cytosolic protein [Candidatus Thiodiazotropha sp. (ex Lucinoma borealis)]|nr:cytosolic protein [Candidatus Thiodiazotropha sp. (ex Lucinoma borealis)]
MKVFMLMAGSGPLMILTSHASIEDPVILEKLAAKGLDKFLTFEVPIELAKERYGGHFAVVANDLHETDDLIYFSYHCINI